MTFRAEQTVWRVTTARQLKTVTIPSRAARLLSAHAAERFATSRNTKTQVSVPNCRCFLPLPMISNKPLVYIYRQRVNCICALIFDLRRYINCLHTCLLADFGTRRRGYYPHSGLVLILVQVKCFTGRAVFRDVSNFLCFNRRWRPISRYIHRLLTSAADMATWLLPAFWPCHSCCGSDGTIVSRSMGCLHVSDSINQSISRVVFESSK